MDYLFDLGEFGAARIILCILLALPVAFVLLLLLGIWGRRRFVRNLWTSSPPRIRLVGQDLSAWRNSEAIRRLVDPLREAGFEEVGPFSIEGVKRAKLLGLVKPSESLAASVQQVPRLGVWLNLVTRYADGSRLVHTTSPHVFVPQTHPGNRLERMLKAGGGEVYRKHLADRPARPTQPVTAAEFPAYFERTYAEVVDHLNARGGPSEEQVRASIRLPRNKEMPDSLVTIARDVLARKAVLGIDVALRDQFGRVAGLTEEELKRVRDRLVFIHDKMMPDDAVDLFNRWVKPIDEASPARPLSAWPRQAFAKLNARLPEAKRYRKIGELDRPLPADIYAPWDCPCEVRIEPEEILVTASLLEIDEDEDG